MCAAVAEVSARVDQDGKTRHLLLRVPGFLLRANRKFGQRRTERFGNFGILRVTRMCSSTAAVPEIDCSPDSYRMTCRRVTPNTAAIAFCDTPTDWRKSRNCSGVMVCFASQVC